MTTYQRCWCHASEPLLAKAELSTYDIPNKDEEEFVMPRPTTKNDLMTTAKENYEKLNLLISKMTEEELNTQFDFSKDEKNSLEDATEMFNKSHIDVLALAEKFTSEELFSKGVYKWTVGITLGSYFVSATASHYDWAMKKLKAHQKNCKLK